MCDHLSQAKLERAERLLSGLGGERTRWTATTETLAQAYASLDGDCLIAAAVIAYMGPFTSTFREEMVTRFAQLCSERGVPCGAGRFSLAAVLGQPVTIRQVSRLGVRVRVRVSVSRSELSACF